MVGHVPARTFAAWLLILLAAFGNPARTAALVNWRTVPTTIGITANDGAQIQDHLHAKTAIIIPTKPSTPESASSEPFGIDAVPATSGELVATWSHLQSQIRAERKILARCRTSTELCSSAMQKFLAIIAEGRARSGRARLAVINRAINLTIQPRVSDHWNTPADTLSTGRGDCKDYAVAKYVALLEAGIAEDDVSLVILHDLTVGENHAVVAVRLDGDWIVLDNRRFTLVEDVETRRVVPLFVLNHDGTKVYTPQRLQPEFAQITP
jgi:predicted transglutaminase-like cysteine proteinase